MGPKFCESDNLNSASSEKCVLIRVQCSSLSPNKLYSTKKEVKLIHNVWQSLVLIAELIGVKFFDTTIQFQNIPSAFQLLNWCLNRLAKEKWMHTKFTGAFSRISQGNATEHRMNGNSTVITNIIPAGSVRQCSLPCDWQLEPILLKAWLMPPLHCVLKVLIKALPPQKKRKQKSYCSMAALDQSQCRQIKRNMNSWSWLNLTSLMQRSAISIHYPAPKCIHRLNESQPSPAT